MRTRRVTVSGAAALALAALLTVSCGGITDPSTNTIEPKTGTVPKGGTSDPIPFSVSKTGEFSIKVTSFTPSFTSQFGLAYGQGDASNCSLNGGATLSTVNSPGLSGPILKGSYCVVVSDAGLFPSAMTFQMTISHP